MIRYLKSGEVTWDNHKTGEHWTQRVEIGDLENGDAIESGIPGIFRIVDGAWETLLDTEAFEIVEAGEL